MKPEPIAGWLIVVHDSQMPPKPPFSLQFLALPSVFEQNQSLRPLLASRPLHQILIRQVRRRLQALQALVEGPQLQLGTDFPRRPDSKASSPGWPRPIPGTYRPLADGRRFTVAAIGTVASTGCTSSSRTSRCSRFRNALSFTRLTVSNLACIASDTSYRSTIYYTYIAFLAHKVLLQSSLQGAPLYFYVSKSTMIMFAAI